MVLEKQSAFPDHGFGGAVSSDLHCKSRSGKYHTNTLPPCRVEQLAVASEIRVD